MKLENAFPAENAASAVVQHEVENMFYLKPHSLRSKEMLNGLKQVKGLNDIVEWSKQCRPKHAHHLKHLK